MLKTSCPFLLSVLPSLKRLECNNEYSFWQFARLVVLFLTIKTRAFVVVAILDVCKVAQQLSQVPLVVERLSSRSLCPSFQTPTSLSMSVVEREEMKCQKY